MRRAVVTEAAFAALSALLALVVAWLVMDLSGARLQVPLRAPEGDLTNSLMVVKSLMNGGFFTNPDIGAPFGTNLRDYPFFWDLFQVVVTKTLGLFSDSPVAVFNTIFVLGFPIIAASGYLALRWLGFARAIAVLGGVLFATLPYHYVRGLGHLYIGQYWTVAFSAALVFQVARAHPIYTRKDGVDGWRAWLTPTTLTTAAIALASGLQLNYYAVFTILLLCLVGAIRALGSRSVRAAVPAAVSVVLVGITFGLMLLPTLTYRMEHGTNELVAARNPQEAEYYGLKLTQLVFPIQGHRIKQLDDFTTEYVRTAPVLGEGQSSPTLGFALAGSLLFAVLVLLAGALTGRAPPGRWRDVGDAGLAGLLAFALGTIGGGSAVFSYVISSQLRGWSRISIFIAFFALIALCSLLTLLADAWRRRRALPAWLAVAALLVLGVLSVLDTSSKDYQYDHEAALVGWQADDRLVREIERQSPKDGMILQLPYVHFPEELPQNRATDFDLFRGYLHAKGQLKWSYGAMKGRPSDWGAAYLKQPDLPTLLPAATSAGFTGLYVDTYHYADGGEKLVADVNAALGVAAPDARGEDGRLVFWSLEPLRARVEASCPAVVRAEVGDALVHPGMVSWGEGFENEEGQQYNVAGYHFGGRKAVLTVENPDPDTARTTTLEFELAIPGGAAGEIVISGLGAARTIRTVAGSTVPVKLPVPLGPGEEKELTFTTDAPRYEGDTRDLHQQVFGLRTSTPARQTCPAP